MKKGFPLAAVPVAVAGFLYLASIALPSAETLSVRGRITDSMGKPVADAAVILMDEKTDRAVATVKTDARGNYVLAGIAPGGYVLRLEKEGMRSAQGRVLIDPKGKNIFDVVMRAEGTAAEKSAGAAKPAKPDWEEKSLQAHDLYVKGQYAEALALYKDVEAAQPDVAAVSFDIGNCYYQLQNYDAALASFQAAVRRQPDFFEAYINLANTYAKLKRSAEAIPFFETAIRMHPAGGRLFLPLGELYLDVGQADKAVLYLRTAVEIEPENPAARYSLGQACARTGDTAEAIASYEKYIELIKDEKEIARVQGLIAELKARIGK